MDGKQAAAVFAADRIQPGQRVGLGTGSTAALVVRRLAERHAAGELPGIRCVPTSRATAQLARSLGLPLATLAEEPLLDVTLDGADEVDPALDLVKGAGGALLHEKMVAQASRRLVIVVDAGKLVRRLCERHPLPVEVFPFGELPELRFLESLGGTAAVRGGTAPLVTDGGNHILDWTAPPGADAALAAGLDARAGIAGHGLFLGMAHEVVIGGADGLKVRRRP
jgi:ribose 5-phosphate isomerase A